MTSLSKMMRERSEGTDGESHVDTGGTFQAENTESAKTLRWGNAQSM